MRWEYSSDKLEIKKFWCGKLLENRVLGVPKWLGYIKINPGEGYCEDRKLNRTGLGLYSVAMFGFSLINLSMFKNTHLAYTSVPLIFWNTLNNILLYPVLPLKCHICYYFISVNATISRHIELLKFTTYFIFPTVFFSEYRKLLEFIQPVSMNTFLLYSLGL
jgi:hypothetical protein